MAGGEANMPGLPRCRGCPPGDLSDEREVVEVSLQGLLRLLWHPMCSANCMRPFSILQSNVQKPRSLPITGNAARACGAERQSYGFLNWLGEDDQQLQPGFYLMRLRQNHDRSRRQWHYRPATVAAPA